MVWPEDPIKWKESCININSKKIISIIFVVMWCGPLALILHVPVWFKLNNVNLSNISHTHRYTYSKTWYFDTIFIFARISSFYIFLINISWFSGFQLTKARVAQRSFILEKKKRIFPKNFLLNRLSFIDLIRFWLTREIWTHNITLGKFPFLFRFCLF